MRKVILFAGVLALLLMASPSLSAVNQKDDPFSWTNGYSLILTSDLTEDQAQATVDYITDNGGQVAIVASPRMLLGWANGSLVGEHGILAVHNRPVPLGLLKNMNVDEVDHVDFFNKVASGKWKAEKAATYGPMQWAKPDVIMRPAASTTELLPSENILVQSPLGTSEFMVGKVKYNVFFVESNGTIDPNLYTWSCADMNTTVKEIAAGLSFWSSKASTYGVPLSFATSYNRPTAIPCAGGTTKVLQAYEPILHAGQSTNGYDNDALWVNGIMCNFGYCAGTSWTRVDAFNNASRISAKTNWATSIFLAYNPGNAPSSFQDGRDAYSYYGSSYAQLLFRSYIYATSGLDRVVSHETAHLFGALDEYVGSPQCTNTDCTTSNGNAKGVVNGNCMTCNATSAACIMRNTESAICGYTPGQLGWGLNISAVKTSNLVNGYTEKTNWEPGQQVHYVVTINVPGKAGECINVRSRWYRQFQNNITESEAYDQPCNLKSGGSQSLILGRWIPSNAAPGEALVEVQLEFYYDSGYFYGRGIRANTRGKFFVLPASANAIPTAPVENSEPRVVPQ